ncbi:MAG: SseB family protein [Chloroflexota bacterium]|nr:SseB family protein [Chloroflexota bacterium]
MSAASVEDFMRALERVHSGANGALATLAHVAPEVWLVVPVEKAPTPGERVQATGVREEDGRILFPVFSSEASLKRWGLRRLWGTLPALAIFEAALAMPCDALVIDAAGPNRMVIGREVLITLVNIARSEAPH